MDNLIELRLKATPDQMRHIADVMAGIYPKPAVTVPDGKDDAVKVETSTSYGDVTEAHAASLASESADDNEGDLGNSTVGSATDAGSSVANSANASTVELDKSGLPWDVRIHASTKTKKADGTWKMRRNTDPVIILQVEAELREALAATPLTATTPLELADNTTTSFTINDDDSITVNGDTTPPPPATDPSAALAAAGNTPPPPADNTPPPPADSPTTFAELLPLVSAGKANGTITDEQVAVAVAAVGLTTFGQLAVRPDMIPEFAAAVGV